MSLMGQVPNRTAFAMMLLGVMAYLLALANGDAGTRLAVLAAIELPVFLLVATVASVAINAVAALGGGLLGGSTLVAAIIAGGLGWSVALAGMAAGDIDFGPQLQPAHAIALATAWLLGGNQQTA